MRRALLFCVAIVFAIACGDNVTEPIPDRTGVTQITPPVSFATTTAEDGLSISTDKDDYAPGDVVHLTGSGWATNDVLDIKLDDDPATHEPHTWTIDVAEDGTFHDSTYVVDVDDVGVTFTLTATSRATLRSLVVMFTDGTISAASIEMRDGSTCTTVQSSVSVGSPICAFASFTVSGSGATKAQFRWKSPTGTIAQISQKTPDFPNNTSGAQSYSATYTPTEAGTWTVLLCESDNNDLALARCQGATAVNPLGATHRASASFTAIAGPTKLAFTSTAFTGVVGQCLGGITVQTQNASNVATNVTGNTTVNLATDGTGAFYSDNACTTAITSVTIASGTNSGSFYYKATARGDGTHALTVSAGGLSPASQTQTINQAGTTTSLTSSSNPSVFGQSVIFEATVAVTAPGAGTPTGSVTFIEGGTCATPTTVLASAVALSSSKASFQTSALSVGSHTIVGCYSGDSDFTSSNGSVTQTVNKASTTTSITSTSPSGSQIVNGQVTVNFSVAVVAPGSGTPTGSVEVKNGGTVLCSASLPSTSCQFTPAAVGQLSLVASYLGDGNFLGSSSTPPVSYLVKYNFDGLFAPVDRLPTLNSAKAGQAIPLKWRLTDADNIPITSLTAVNIKIGSLACGTSPYQDAIEEYAAGSSGLQNLGDGNYQFNWKTPSGYALQCKSIGLDFGSGYVEYPLASFQFKK